MRFIDGDVLLLRQFPPLITVTLAAPEQTLRRLAGLYNLPGSNEGEPQTNPTVGRHCLAALLHI